MSASFSLEGRVAVVTGATGLLGIQHCKTLADAGATVYAVDMQEEPLNTFVRELGDQHVPYVLDVTSAEGVLALRDQLKRNHGGVDILVNNAAINDMVERPNSTVHDSMFENYGLDMFRRVMDVNVSSMFYTTQVLGELMAQAGKGSIINIGSTYGVAAPNQDLYRDVNGVQRFYKGVAYPVSKSAVIMMTRFISTYWGPRGVRANCISPGGVQNGQEEWFVQQYSARTPLGRMALPDDFAGALLFLASDASRYVTGQNLQVDGGWTTW
jgi:NAD(P)-dependent dehydrogenase (short-subunit alcohol dehydrogenase family)